MKTFVLALLLLGSLVMASLAFADQVTPPSGSCWDFERVTAHLTLTPEQTTTMQRILATAKQGLRVGLPDPSQPLNGEALAEKWVPMSEVLATLTQQLQAALMAKHPNPMAIQQRARELALLKLLKQEMLQAVSSSLSTLLTPEHFHQVGVNVPCLQPSGQDDDTHQDAAAQTNTGQKE